ncbi:MAG: ABC transporter permease [Chloroflexi bacterium]|nr:ABC transporter permease [Chloroflexota bacterium]
MLTKRVIANPRVRASGLVIVVLALIALFAAAIAPHDPARQYAGQVLKPPSAEYPLGTDDFGRDMFSRVVWGTRISLQVAAVAVLIAGTLGVFLGLLAGYFGGWVDTLIMRWFDVMLSFPTVVLALAIVTFLGNSLPNLMLTIGIAQTPTFARLVHGAVLSVKQNEYVEAGRVVGASDWRIIRKAILPNIAAPIIIQASLSAGFAILVESGLSFLGLGVMPPTPSWGQMVSTARGYMDLVPSLVLWPSLAVAVTVLSFNMLGDGLRDALDPRLIGR